MSFLRPPCCAARIRRASAPPRRRRAPPPAPPSQTSRLRRRRRSAAVTTSLTVPSTCRPVDLGEALPGSGRWSGAGRRRRPRRRRRRAPRISTAVRKIGRFGEAGALGTLGGSTTWTLIGLVCGWTSLRRRTCSRLGEQVGHIAASARRSRWSSRACSAARPGSVDWREVSWPRSDWSWPCGARSAAGERAPRARPSSRAARRSTDWTCRRYCRARARRRERAQARDLLRAAATTSGCDSVQPGRGLRLSWPSSAAIWPVAVPLLVAADAGDGRRRRGELGAHRRERAVGGGDLLVEIGELGLRRGHAVARSSRRRAAGP